MLCDLPFRGVIRVSGSDATSFLQGQITSDIEKLTPGESQLGAYCSPKGRMLACFRLFRRDNTIYLIMPGEQIDAVLKRLRMFVLRADVKLDDVSAAMPGIGIIAPAPPRHDKNAVHLLSIAADRFEVYGENDAIMALREQLMPEHELIQEQDWRLLDIRAGIPQVYPVTTDAFVPLMANLDLLGGISYHKGCYVGQEIVARTHYLGKLKRRMYRLSGQGAAPAAGTELFAPDQRGEQAVGAVVDAVASAADEFEALAVIVMECAEAGSLYLAKPTGRPLQLLNLPYSFEQAA